MCAMAKQAALWWLQRHRSRIHFSSCKSHKSPTPFTSASPITLPCWSPKMSNPDTRGAWPLLLHNHAEVKEYRVTSFLSTGRFVSQDCPKVLQIQVWVEQYWAIETLSQQGDHDMKRRKWTLFAVATDWTGHLTKQVFGSNSRATWDEQW